MSVSSQPRVSIVTPVYNDAEYLAECLESILAQTYRNWDLTIVNNCSTDTSIEIARRYATKDSRIRIHDNQQFLRAIPNHNHSLRQISPESKYCKIVFADDWIFPECLEKMVRVAEENPSVGLISAYNLEGLRVACTGLPYPSFMVSGRKIGREHFLRDLYVWGAATTVMYRSDLVRSHDPFFNEDNIHADTEVCFELLKSCDFGFVHQVLTFTRVRQGSLTSISNDLHTYYAGMLHTLKTYGPDFLNQEEFNARLDYLLGEYYAFLAKSVVIGRDRKFWDFHKKKLADLGVPFSRLRLTKAVLAFLASAVISLKNTIEKLRKSDCVNVNAEDPSPIPSRRTGHFGNQGDAITQ